MSCPSIIHESGTKILTLALHAFDLCVVFLHLIIKIQANIFIWHKGKNSRAYFFNLQDHHMLIYVAS